MREVWLILGEYATGIYRDLPAWVVDNQEFTKWKKAENEVEAKKQIRNTYSSEALFLMELEDLTEMRMNVLYVLPPTAVGTFKETRKEWIEE